MKVWLPSLGNASKCATSNSIASEDLAENGSVASYSTCITWDGNNGTTGTRSTPATVTKPEEAEGKALLQQEIITQLTSRMHELSTQDRRRNNHNLIHLLNKPLSYRKSWIVNTKSSRQRFLRIQQQDNDLIVQSKAVSRLYQWIKVNHSVPTSNNTSIYLSIHSPPPAPTPMETKVLRLNTFVNGAHHTYHHHQLLSATSH